MDFAYMVDLDECVQEMSSYYDDGDWEHYWVFDCQTDDYAPLNFGDEE
jgi:hypothetical protein